MKLEWDKISFHEPLQIVQAEVKLVVDGDEVIQEPLCIDVGLPALLLSGLEDTRPNRWAPPEAWESMPFFVCGCGDPECRVFSFIVRHTDQGTVLLSEVEETGPGETRLLEEYEVPLEVYRNELIRAGDQFMQYMEHRNYHPLYSGTMDTVHQLLQRLKA
jgi:hypothetical protein